MRYIRESLSLVMDALVLCGGRGTRFSSISKSPKILAKIDDNVFLTFIINYLRSLGIKNIYLSVGYKSEEIINFVEEYHTDKDIFIVKEDRPLGTGGAVKLFFQNFDCKFVFVINGDTYWDEKISLVTPEVGEEKLTLWYKTICKNDRFGHIEKQHNGVRFLRGTIDNPFENSKTYVGFSIIPATLFSNELKEPFSLECAISQFKGKVDLIPYNGNYHDFGIPEAYHKLRKKFIV